MWHLKGPIMPNFRILLTLGTFVIFLGISSPLFAQHTPPSISGGQHTEPQGPPQDMMNDTTGSKAQKGAVNFTAQDSLVFILGKQREATMYGAAKVIYQGGNLSAGTVALNLDQHVVSAKSAASSDTLAQPVLMRGSDRIRSKEISFNYKTKKGRFEVAKVDVSQGILIGSTVKNKTSKVVFIRNAIYSTCKLDHPHFYLKAKEMKVVNQKEIFFKDARLYILDIPYPIPLPFGYVPAKISKHQSGFLAPTYAFQQQQQGGQQRGLGLQNLGWFQYFNDYLTGQVSLDIYTSGSFVANSQINYAKRDEYTGHVDLGYSRDQGLEPTDPNYTSQIEKKISISHNQTLSPYAGLSASINYVTNNYYQKNSYNIGQRAQVNTTSYISYHYNQPDNLYNFSISANQSQNLTTNYASLSGPNMNFSLKTLTPFQNDNTESEKTKWYQTISLQYSNSFQSSYQFNPIAGDSSQVNWLQAIMHPSLYHKATGQQQLFNFGFKQDGSISLQLLPNSNFHLTGGGNFSEFWYPETIRETFNPDSNTVETHYVKGFTAAHEFSTSLSLNTRLFGIWNQRIGNLYGFRHTISPTISFSYSPDFSSPFWGIYRTVQTDTLGDKSKYAIYGNNSIGGPGAGESRILSFSVSNILETKQIKRDSTGEKKERVIKLIDNLGANLSYNFAAKRNKLSDLNMNMSTSIINNMNIRASARFSFYATDSTGNITNHYLLGVSGKLLRMTQFSMGIGTNFRGGKGGGLEMNSPVYYPAHYNPLNQSIFNPVDPLFNEKPIVPFSVPWSFSVNMSYSWSYNPRGKARQSGTINASSITFSPTPKWQVSTSLGYDFIQNKLTPSQFSVSRNLHCWNLNFTFNPFGSFKYYLFSLTVNSSQFQTIMQKLPGLNNLQQSNSPINSGGFGSFGSFGGQ